MISLLEFVLLLPGALLDIEIDRSEKTPIKAIKNVLIFGKNASFVLRFCYWFQFVYQRKKSNLFVLARLIRHKNVFQRRK